MFSYQADSDTFSEFFTLGKDILFQKIIITWWNIASLRKLAYTWIDSKGHG